MRSRRTQAWKQTSAVFADRMGRFRRKEQPKQLSSSFSPGKVVVGFDSAGYEAKSEPTGTYRPIQKSFSQITLQLRASTSPDCSLAESLSIEDRNGDDESEDEKGSDDNQEGLEQNGGDFQGSVSPSSKSTPLAIPSVRCVPISRVPRVCSGRELCGACPQCAELLVKIPCLWGANKVNGGMKVDGGAVFAS